jgi:hypothetical protein
VLAFRHHRGTVCKVDNLICRQALDSRGHCRSDRCGGSDGKSASVGRDRCLPRASDQIGELVRPVKDAHRGAANSRSTSVMISGNSSGIAAFVKLPERPDARMHAFAALEEFATDTRVCDGPVPNDRICYGEGSFRIVSRLAEQPFVLPVPSISWNRRGRGPLESSDAIWIPPENIFTGEVLGLFADRVACGDAVQAGENSTLRRGFHSAKISSEPPDVGNCRTPEIDPGL